MSGLKSYDYLVAINLLKRQNTFQLSTTENNSQNDYPQEENMIILPSINKTQEELLIKQQSFDNLSSEAKHIILRIINSSDEFINQFKTPKKAILSKRIAKDIFSVSYKSEFIIDTIWKEIKLWIKENLE